MKKSRRIGAILAMATTAVGMASVAASAPATAAARGPEPVSDWLRPIRAHSANRVDIYWRTDRMICDVEVRVGGPRVDVDYPGHQRFATFGRGGTLRPGRADFTSVQVNPDFDRPGVVRLRAFISYDDCSFHARTRTDSFFLTVPVVRGDNWPGQGFPGGPGNGDPGHGWPGNGDPGNGHGNGGPGNGHGNGDPGNGHGNGDPGNGHGNAGQGNAGQGNAGQGNGGQGNGGQGNGGQGNGGQGNGGQGNGGQGNGGQGNGGHHPGTGTGGQGH